MKVINKPINVSPYFLHSTEMAVNLRCMMPCAVCKEFPRKYNQIHLNDIISSFSLVSITVLTYEKQKEKSVRRFCV